MIELFTKASGATASVQKIDMDNPKFHLGGWVIVENPTEAEEQLLSEYFDLKPGNLSDALDPHESPRLDHDAKHDYLYLRQPHVNRDGAMETRPLLIIYSDKDFITVAPSGLGQLRDSLNDNKGFATHSSKHTLFALVQLVLSQYETYIRGQSESIKRIIDKMKANRLESEDFVRFVLVGEQINSFLNALEPTTLLFRRLATTKFFALTSDDRDVVEDIILSIEQSVHICHTNIDRITSVREAYAALSNNSLNRTMKALTAATLFIALPNVVFGMYGMNINLPIQHEAWAFVVIISTTLVAVLAIILLAKRKRWF